MFDVTYSLYVKNLLTRQWLLETFDSKRVTKYPWISMLFTVTDML